MNSARAEIDSEMKSGTAEFIRVRRREKSARTEFIRVNSAKTEFSQLKTRILHNQRMVKSGNSGERLRQGGT